MPREGVMDWNERAADYPLNSERPSILYTLKVIEKESPVRNAIVDIGCGPGNESLPFSEIFEHVYSVDSSPRMLDRLRATCAERGVDNISIIESDCLSAQVPGPCQVAHSCLCPGMFSKEGLQKIEDMSEDLCIFVGHLFEADCPERNVFREAGIPFYSRMDSVRILDEFIGDREVTQARFSDFPARNGDEVLQRCLRMVDETEENRTRLTEAFESLGPSELEPKNNVVVFWWHKNR